MAFLPQFIEPAYPHTMLSFILPGGTFTVTGTLWCLLLAIYAAKFSALLQRGEQQGSLLGKVSGVLFIGMGVNSWFWSNKGADIREPLTCCP